MENMSLKSQETIAANQRKITFDVDAETFRKAIEKVYRRQVKNITIPGFRKGHAPRAIIERMYGKEVFFEDAVNEIIPDAYEEAAKEITETVVSRPEFDLVSASVEDGVVLSCTFFVKPEVEISDYLGIPVERPAVKVTEDEVNEEMEKMAEQMKREVEEGKKVISDDMKKDLILAVADPDMSVEEIVDKFFKKDLTDEQRKMVSDHIAKMRVEHADRLKRVHEHTDENGNYKE